VDNWTFYGQGGRGSVLGDFVLVYFMDGLSIKDIGIIFKSTDRHTTFLIISHRDVELLVDFNFFGFISHDNAIDPRLKI